ncbi:MAG TPA: hypothetical protein VIH30_00020, partial [Aquirhabdus sp.]
IAFTSNDERRLQLIKEWKRNGGKILPVHISKSKKNCCLEGVDLRMGWVDVLGIGEKLAEKLANNAPYQGSQDLQMRVKPSANTIKMLEDTGIIPRTQLDLFQKPDHINNDLLVKHCPWIFDLNLSRYRSTYCRKLIEVDATQHQQQITVVGMVRELNLRDLNELNNSRGRADAKAITGPTKFVNAYIEDEDDALIVTFSRKVYPKVQERVWLHGGVGNIIRCSGVVMPEIRKLYANTIEVLGRVTNA